MLLWARSLALPGWNRRRLTEADFLGLCQREAIILEEAPLSVPGFYGICHGKRFIAVDSRLRGEKRLFCLWHEMAHHLLHAPRSIASVNFYHLREEPKVKFEADAFAAVALLPRAFLRQLLKTPETEWEMGFAAEIVEVRLKVLRFYKI